jgi:cold shock CspA family protein
VTSLAGTVVEFDDHVGLGVIDDGEGHRYPFHCIEIADGTRAIEIGTTVGFVVLAKLGRYEAADIRPR